MEAALGALYLEFSRVFVSDGEAHALFSRLSQEEKSHLMLIQFEKRLMKQNPGLLGEVNLEPGAILEVCDRAEKARRHAGRMTLREAVELALALEGSDAESYIRDLQGGGSPELVRLVKNLRAGDHAHHQALLAFAQSRGFAKAGEKRG